ncbi:hypothetical protein [Sinorhizobium fredii]|uniref:hypothetical protein n=1 Tax=Rhizobium fredii TaxID=380 RepID=UPI001FCBD699|nr:hypothetical protein [Sinorhizobium fredii]
MALPQYRKQLFSVKSRELDDLFEAYALAGEAIERLTLDVPQRSQFLAEYRTICESTHAKVLRLLGEYDSRA